jgi:hypothetical protein
MPVRSFKVDIANQSNYLSLRQTGVSACSGGWTDGWGTPPSVIGAGQSIGFQGESDAVFGGTEGWVKYDAIDNGGNRHGELYVYWDNPYYGATRFKASVVHGDVVPDCNAAPSEFDTNDSQTPDFGGTWVMTDLDGNDGITEPITSGNLLNALWSTGSGILAGIPALLGTENIVAHAHLTVTIQDVQVPGYTSTSYTYTPASSPLVADWIGHWTAEDVDIQIARKTGDILALKLQDNASSPPLSITLEADVGQHTIELLKRQTNALLNDSKSTISAGQMHAVKTAIDHVLSTTNLPHSRTQLAAHFKHALSSDHGIAREAINHSILNQIADHLIVPLFAKDVVGLGQGVSLALMNCFADGNPNGKTVRYQRVVAGALSRDVEARAYTSPPR